MKKIKFIALAFLIVLNSCSDENNVLDDTRLELEQLELKSYLEENGFHNIRFVPKNSIDNHENITDLPSIKECKQNIEDNKAKFGSSVGFDKITHIDNEGGGEENNYYWTRRYPIGFQTTLVYGFYIDFCQPTSMNSNLSGWQYGLTWHETFSNTRYDESAKRIEYYLTGEYTQAVDLGSNNIVYYSYTITQSGSIPCE
ncbi:hypothetical protein [Tenacibaculum sp. SG-28]|uniref:hypothetical protein n=1 Tax=Tenacibaculum sp. SG-28 TaxID=754426 RepID=UPI000CF4DB21|nr:hypothetical protein [Tenacibaculum sp. SG-28]PQJ23366.1 hypothetical protein BSU00_04010 [Tenacibaculum sp. SG-28]